MANLWELHLGEQHKMSTHTRTRYTTEQLVEMQASEQEKDEWTHLLTGEVRDMWESFTPDQEDAIEDMLRSIIVEHEL